MSRRTLTNLAAAALILAVLGGCGDGGGSVAGDPAGGEGTSNSDNPFDDKSSLEIQQMIIDGMGEVDSVRVAADLITDGASLGMVIVMDRDANCDGSLTTQGARADLKGDKTYTYLKGDRAFWVNSVGDEQQADMVLSVLGDKWVRMSATGEDGFSSICDLDELLDEFDSTDSESAVNVGTVSTIDGHEVIELSTSDPSDEEKTRMWVTAEAPHRIVKMKVEGGDEPGEFHFTKFNEPVDVELPGAGEWVDFDEMAG